MKLLKKLLLIGQLCLATTVMAQTTPLPAIQKFIKPSAAKYAGVFNVYLQEDKYYLEIPDTLLNRDILSMIVINKGSAQVSRDSRKRFGFSGDVVHEAVFKFNKGKKGAINIEQSQFYVAPKNEKLSTYEATLKNKVAPIVSTFAPVAQDATATLIDITATFNSDMPFLSLSGGKDELGLGPYQSNMSRPLGVAAYKNNIVFRSVRAYGAGAATPKPQGLTPAEPQQPAEQDKQMNGPTIWEIGASWYLLPAQPMRQRIADKRVGYFTRSIVDYSKNANKTVDRGLAARWKIEPKPQDIEKYKRGELVEPAEPIVFYVDKNTPAYLQPYFIAGVNAWQSAFEKIGFKNAIIAKMEPTPEENPDFSIDNASYSVISYKPSTTANAYGPMVVDPRSGQIISSHVAVFHNITDLLQRWYFIMCSVNDPEARKLPLSQDIMGRLMKMVITHEVGHTLGLRHDFAGSHTYDVDSVRNKAFVAKNGFGASIMDYLRFNYVAQPEDGFTAEELLPKIGIYDDYAIEWGYKYFPQYKTAEQEAEVLKNWVTQKRKDPRFFYFPEGDFSDPRVQSEDMGSNAMKAGTLGIKNLKVIMQNLEAWLEKDDDENYTMMKRMHSAVASRYNEYLAHVLKNIGGRYADQALVIEDKPNYQPVSRAVQKEAMAFINEYYFKEPKWLFPDHIVDKTRFTFAGPVAADYETFLGRVFFKFSSISKNERIVGQQQYQASEFLADIYNGVFSDLENETPISEYRRTLQRGYVNKLLSSVYNSANDNDVAIILKQQIESVKQSCDKALQKQTDATTKAHLNAISAMIQQWQGKKPTS
ncbi:zinc-dependent metalloprotease [Pedobacter sp. SL55]|uniref:zinc-dependent metalloprotease n=1 Tax=Pedobacter sp. SL55 TaxID=2995161 RepID=UPI00226D643C|nr:zinc-dependent metalloprotease [Pedobacter sp. SL55]WAC41046.1 zinc-dependent metalloprotease [Pedobacter sp. SL55]